MPLGHRIPEGVEPGFVLSIANQFIETGQLANYLRAQELGRVVASWYDGPLAAGTLSPADTRRLQRQEELRIRLAGLKRAWRRAPLLVLLTAWLAIGFTGGIVAMVFRLPEGETNTAFQLWGLGFPGLVVLQFVLTIRTALRPRSSRPSRTRGVDR
jgi:hypothetical protein